MSAIPETPSTPNPEHKDHDEKGRFTKGNHASHGNPFTRQCAQLRSAALAFADAGKVKEIIEAIYNAARKGDMAAAKLFLEYTIGKPTQAIDPDTLDVDEWSKERQKFVHPDGMLLNSVCMPIDLANILSSTQREAHREKLTKQFLADMKAREEAKAKGEPIPASTVLPFPSLFPEQAQRQAANERQPMPTHRQPTASTVKANAKKKRRNGKHRRSSPNKR